MRKLRVGNGFAMRVDFKYHEKIRLAKDYKKSKSGNHVSGGPGLKAKAAYTPWLRGSDATAGPR